MPKYKTQEVEHVPGMSSQPEPKTSTYVCGKCGATGVEGNMFSNVGSLFEHYKTCGDPIEVPWPPSDWEMYILNNVYYWRKK